LSRTVLAHHHGPLRLAAGRQATPAGPPECRPAVEEYRRGRLAADARLCHQGEEQATPDIATKTQWWRAPGQPQAVLAWVRAHLPAGFTLGSYGSGTYEPGPSVMRLARRAAVINGLTLFPAGEFSCPIDFGAEMRFTFRTRPDGPVVARLNAEYCGCGVVSVSIGGTSMPALSDYAGSGAQLQQRVLAIAGVRWPYPPGAPPGSGD